MTLMPEPSTYSLSRYLKAKQTVDERALNQRVEERFYSELRRLASETDGAASVVDLGAGLGPSARRLVLAMEAESAVSMTYHLVDQSPQLQSEAHSALLCWMQKKGYAVEEGQSTLCCRQENREFTFRFHTTDALTFLDDHWRGPLIAVIAQSFLDLLNIPTTLARIQKQLRNSSLLYFPLTFNGQTRFLPQHSGNTFRRIVEHYHDSMERETVFGLSGGAQTGRQLLEEIPSVGSFVAVGSSDWLVYPKNDNGYEGDEAYFLHHILHFVENELTSDPRVAPDALTEWMNDRRKCVEEEQLIYQASQLDVLARLD